MSKELKVEIRPSYFVRVGDAVSQLLNVVLFNGDANESISGRSYREKRKLANKFINMLLSPIEKNHCRLAYITDAVRASLVVQSFREDLLKRKSLKDSFSKEILKGTIYDEAPIEDKGIILDILKDENE